MRWLVLGTAFLASCAKGGGDAGVPPDAIAIDAAPCPLWYADGDGDGHGDPAAPMESCTEPAGHVDTADDCDDASPLVHPGRADVCDGLDNDCSAATTDVCPAGCVLRTDDARLYLFCSTGATWPNAGITCASQFFRLARVDTAEENTWIRITGNEAIGTGDFWLGGSDQVGENAWLWDDGAQFWQGTSGGTVVGGLYAAWSSGEPNNDGNEDCAEMYPSGLWNDVGCGEVQPYACERY
jgi:hypothetical protein